MLNRKNITLRMDVNVIDAVKKISRQVSAAYDRDISVSDIVEGALLKEYPKLAEVITPCTMDKIGK